ncbi:MAG: GntR family transcriptional regulator [Bowdeniella nasicola]|nr:GntR family transcriptional regulator [Bowdeniella nasicola]
MAFSRDTPIYSQIADDIRRQILECTARAGDRLLSTTEYAATYRINPATAAKAFNILEAEGLVEKRRGLGVYVTESAHAVLLERRRSRFYDDVVVPCVAEGYRLGLTIDEVLAAVARAAEHLSEKDTTHE